MKNRLLRKTLVPKPMASDRRAVHRRARRVSALMIACMFGIAAKAYAISIRDHESYAEQSHRQQLRSYTLTASRGEVVDRGRVALAVNDRVYNIILNPREIRGRRAEESVVDTLRELIPAEEFDEEALRSELARDKAYRRLKRVAIDEEQSKELMGRGLPGVWLEPATRRVYPRGLLAAHILGRVNGQGVGHLGVELGMEEHLRGRDTQSPAYYANGRKLLLDGYPDPEVSRGDTVELTIDSAIQAMVEREVDAVVARWNPVGASIIVLEPRSGEILAMANRPTFDPNHPIETLAQTTDLATQAAYEPGSTMKAITVAAALEEGVIRENETLYCEKGRYQFTKKNVIRDTHRAEWLDITQILAQSSNICTTKIAMRLGKRSQYRWARRFHFGERPDIQLPGATRGLLAEPEKWSDIQAANVSFGQGMSASPLQVAAAFAVLANDGLYNAPTIVRRVVDNSGGTVYEHTPTRERVVRRSTAHTVLRMLESVVTAKHGTGKNAAIPGYRVAGKTSTAQKADLEKRAYTEDQYYASFVGAVPARDPAVVILISVDNPEGGHFGNEVAAPSFSRLGTQIMDHLAVPPDDGSAPRPKARVVRAGPDGERVIPVALVELEDEGVEPPLPGAKKRVKPTTGLPDFTGMSITQALDAAEQARVVIRPEGSGVAVMQDTAPGPVDDGAVVRVIFEPPS